MNFDAVKLCTGLRRSVFLLWNQQICRTADEFRRINKEGLVLIIFLVALCASIAVDMNDCNWWLLLIVNL